MSLNLLSMDLLSALTVSVVYSIIVNFAYGAFWGKVAKAAPNTMTRFYLAASALRLITAALVVVSFCMLIGDKGLIRSFIFIFFAFYFVMLIFDSVFFARIEKYNNLKTEK